MFNQYFYTDAYQNDTCPKLGPEVDTLAEEDTDKASQYGEQERYDADNDDRAEDALEGIHAYAGKRNAYSQSINTRSYG